MVLVFILIFTLIDEIDVKGSAATTAASTPLSFSKAVASERTFYYNYSQQS